MLRAQAPTLPVWLSFDKKYAVGALNVNSLKEFRDASPEDATGTAWRCSDLHSPDNSMVRNAQDRLHLQEVENRLPCEWVDGIYTIRITHMDRNVSFSQWTIGLVEGRVIQQSYHRAPQEGATRIIMDAPARLGCSPEVCHGRRRRRCSGSQTAAPGPGNKGGLRLRANKLRVRLTITANEPTFWLLHTFGDSDSLKHTCPERGEGGTLENRC